MAGCIVGRPNERVVKLMRLPTKPPKLQPVAAPKGPCLTPLTQAIHRANNSKHPWCTHTPGWSLVALRRPCLPCLHGTAIGGFVVSFFFCDESKSLARQSAGSTMLTFAARSRTTVGGLVTAAASVVATAADADRGLDLERTTQRRSAVRERTNEQTHHGGESSGALATDGDRMFCQRHRHSRCVVIEVGDNRSKEIVREPERRKDTPTDLVTGLVALALLLSVIVFAL